MLSKEKRTQIIEALKTNPNTRAVARQVGGVSNVTVWKIARQVDIDLLNPKLSEEKRTQIIEALKFNSNSHAVAKQVGGVSQGTVWEIAKQTGIELTDGKAAKGNRQPRLSEEKRTQIIAAFKANPNASAVARQLGGVSRQTIRKIARQASVSPPQQESGAVFRRKGAP